MYTLNLPMNGGALMNGMGQVKVFQSELEARAYLKSEFPDNERGLIISPIHLVSLTEALA